MLHAVNNVPESTLPRRKVPEITQREAEAALRNMKNLIIGTLKAGDDTISKTLAKLRTTRLSERRLPTAWKNAKVVVILKKGNKEDTKKY